MLEKSLAEIDLNELSEQQREEVLHCFDRVIVEKFRDIPNEAKAKIKGTSKCYNNVDDVWKFTIEDVEIKEEGTKPLNEHSKLMQVVAYSSSENPVEPRQTENLRRRA